MEPNWIKPCVGGDCVEVAQADDGMIAVRDSKNPDGPVLAFTAAEWQSFRDAVKTGHFDGVTA